MDEITLRALVATAALAATLGPLGCFVVWRRMAYLGDTIAHASLLGVAASLIVTALPITLAIFLVAIAVALLLYQRSHDTRFHADTLLGILSHGSLALGVLLVALSRKRVDINAYLFGDIFLLDWTNVAALLLLASVVLAMLMRSWRALLMVTISPAIAHVEGVNARRTQLLLLLMLAAVIAIAIQMVGALLITALLVIPAATARYVAHGPLQMACYSVAIGVITSVSGLFAALSVDAPAGPTMVVVAAFGFVMVGALTQLRR